MTMMMKTMMMTTLSVSNCPAGIHQCCTSYDLQPFITKSTYMFNCILRVWLLSNFRVYFYFVYFKKLSFITFSWLFILTICTFISCGTFLLSQTKYCKKNLLQNNNLLVSKFNFKHFQRHNRPRHKSITQVIRRPGGVTFFLPCGIGWAKIIDTKAPVEAKNSIICHFSWCCSVLRD